MPLGAKRDRLVSRFGHAGEQRADARGELRERRLIRRQIKLDSPGVHRAADFATVQIREDGVACIDADCRLRFIRARAEVRRQHDILQSKQRVILRRRLFREHIQRRAADLLFLDRLGKRDFIDHFAAGVIDDEEVRPALVEQPLAVEQVLGAFAAGDVEGDHVDLRDELIEIADHLHAAIQCRFAGEERVESDDVHLHCQRPRRDGSPDAPQANDAERFPGKLCSLVHAALLPIQRAGGESMMRCGNFPRQAHHQRQCMFRGGKRGCFRGVHHQDALRCRRRQVDVIDADAGPGDRFELAGVLQRFRDRGFVRLGADDHRVVFADDLREFVFGDSRFDIKRNAGLLQEFQALVSQFISNQNFHVCNILWSKRKERKMVRKSRAIAIARLSNWKM